MSRPRFAISSGSGTFGNSLQRSQHAKRLRDEREKQFRTHPTREQRVTLGIKEVKHGGLE